MNTIRRTILFVCSMAALVLVSPCACLAWEISAQGLQSTHLPASFKRLEQPVQADMNGDGLAETLRLVKGHLAILSGTQVVWQSPDSWRVDQVAFSDLDRNDVTEVTLLLWRPFRPWPVDAWLPHGGRISEFHDADDQSCHLILIGWIHGEFDELWAGSALAEPIIAFAAADLDADGEQELATLESAYEDTPSHTAKKLKVWEWNGFGFDAVYSQEGRFYQMQIVRTADGCVLILSS